MKLPWSKEEGNVGGSLGRAIKRDLRVQDLEGWTYKTVPTTFRDAVNDYEVQDLEGKRYLFREFKGGLYTMIERFTD